uniref:Midasin AAA lid domain-containing protein n=1 Tax=Ditylenchus dipsaci TaxID=166011 RepID=A0A915DF54_9BILA
MSSEGNLNLLRDYPYAVNLQPLTNEEHSQILSMRFPNLVVIKEKVLTVFNVVCEKMKSSCSKSDRQLNSSDLFRLCNRLNSLDDLSDNVRLLHEFLDVWVMHLANMELRTAVAQVIAQALSITEQQLAFVMNMRRPDIELQDKVIVVGRTRLTRHLDRKKQTHSYGLTRGYSQLIEQIATCVGGKELGKQYYYRERRGSGKPV